MLILRALIQLLGHEPSFLSRVMSKNVVWLHLRQVELLWAKDGTRSSDSDPSDKALSRDLEVLHGPEPDQGSCSSQTSLAVNGDGAVIWLVKVSLDNFEKVFHNVIWRS